LTQVVSRPDPLLGALIFATTDRSSTDVASVVISMARSY
jgi:hypothetical protein